MNASRVRSRQLVAISTILLMVALAAAALALHDEGRDVGQELPSSSIRTVDILGDSYTSGTAIGGLGQAGYPQIVARMNGWQVKNLAVGGTGYVTSIYNLPIFGAPIHIGTIAEDRPDLVLVVGGRNDLTVSAEQIGAAALQLYRTLINVSPRSRVVVVGIIWPGPVPPSVSAANGALRDAAKTAGVDFIDPISEGWFQEGASIRMIGSDGVHPTDAGHAYIANLLERDLRKLF